MVATILFFGLAALALVLAAVVVSLRRLTATVELQPPTRDNYYHYLYDGNHD